MRFCRFLLMITLFFSLCTARAWAVSDGIVAVVNEDIITLKDLKDYMNSTVMQLRLEGRTREEIKSVLSDLEQTGLTKLIESRLIVSKANEIGMEIDKKAIDLRLEEIKAKYPSEEAFMRGLLMDGATLTDLRNKIEEQYKIRFMIEQEVKNKIIVNPQEITEYYEKHKNEFLRPERVNLGSIFIGFEGDNKASEAKANEALAKIAAGEDFEKVAAEYSQRAPIGIVSRGQLLPALENTIFLLKVGEVSSIVQAPDGYYIFRANGKIDSEVPAIEDIRINIRSKISQIKFMKKFASWMDKLKREAYIEIKE